MSAVGIRELKAQTSAIMRRVEAGEAVDVTHHGRVIARIVPVMTRDAEIAETLAVLDDMDALAAEIAAELPAGAPPVTTDELMRDIRRDV